MLGKLVLAYIFVYIVIAKDSKENQIYHVALISGCHSHIVQTTPLATTLLNHVSPKGTHSYRVTYLSSQQCKHVAEENNASFFDTGKWNYEKLHGDDFLTVFKQYQEFSAGEVIYTARALESLVAHDRPDLVIADLFALGATSIAEYYNIPLVVHWAAALPNYRMVVNGYPLKSPSIALDSPAWLHDLLNVVAMNNFRFLAYFYTWQGHVESDRIRAEKQLPPLKGFLTACNSYPNLAMFGEPLLQNRDIPGLTVTGMLPVSADDMSLLDTELINFAESSTRPIVYLAMGTESKFSEEEFLSLKEVFESQDTFNIIWAHLGWTEEVTYDKSRMLIRKKFPQRETLNLKPVRVFVSHCGLSSLTEGVYREKAFIAVPFGRDQFDGAQAVTRNNFGVYLTSRDKPGFTAALKTVHENLDLYQANVKKVKEDILKGSVEKLLNFVDEQIATKKTTVLEFEYKTHYVHIIYVSVVLAFTMLLYFIGKWLALIICRSPRKLKTG